MKKKKIKNKKPNKRKHIDKEERITIEKMLKGGHTQKEIAKTLKRSRSAISEEIKKGKCEKTEYIGRKKLIIEHICDNI